MSNRLWMQCCAMALVMIGALGADKLVWESLYPPPYSDLPATVIIGISCVDRSHCYIPGGANGAGFRVFDFNGVENGRWSVIPTSNMMLMIISIAMGGTPTNLHGGIGGLGFLGVTQGLEYYNTSSTSFQVPKIPFQLAEAIQSMDTTNNGTFVVALDQGSSNGVFVSEDGGANFELRPLTGVPSLKNCSFPQYISIVDKNTWFVTLAATPPQQNLHQSVRFGGAARKQMQWRRSPMHSVSYDTSKQSYRWIRHSLAEARQYRADRYALYKNNTCNFYASVMAKTTDGGKTYTIPFVQDNATFAFDLISCYDATHCVATGFNDDASFIYTTTDGQNFKRVLSVPSTPDVSSSLFAVAHRSRDEVWVAGGSVTQESSSGLFYFSHDGGLTWMHYPVPTPDIASVMDMDFTADGDGFATAISLYDTSTIMKYASQPYYGYFTQCQCVDSNCLYLCQNATFPQGMCLPSTTGGMEVFCAQNELMVKNYETTTCIGSYTNSTMPLNQCLQSTSGNYFKNFCGPSVMQAPGIRKVLRTQ